MPITELAILRLKEGKAWDDISTHMRLASQQQAAWSGYPLQFFEELNDKSTIFLLSGWDSVEAHQAWIASDENQSLLQALGPSLDVKDLLHLSIQPEKSWEGVRGIIYERRLEGEGNLGVGRVDSDDAHSLRKELAHGLTDVASGIDVEGKTGDTFWLLSHLQGEIDGLHVVADKLGLLNGWKEGLKEIHLLRRLEVDNDISTA